MRGERAQKAGGVLYLAIDVFLKGGIQRYTRAQIQALRELLGVESVTTLVLHPSPKDERLGFEDFFDVEYVEAGRNTISRLRFILRALTWGLQTRPAVIWTDEVKLFPLAVFLRIASRAQAVIGNVYGLEVWSGLTLLERVSIRWLTVIVSDSHFTARYMRERFHVPAARVTVVWDPVDTVRFVPRDSAAQILPRYGIPHGANNRYIMTAGRVTSASRHKGYDRVLDILKKLPDKRLIYLIVGDGNDRPRLEERVRSEGLDGRVFFLGAVPEADLVDVYNAAHIFVLVSDRGPGRGEGVPLTPLEAAACCVPIIVGDEDGSQEAVDDEINGYIVSPKDLDLLGRRILGLAEDGELRQRMGRAARKKVETCFSYSRFRDETGAILRQLHLHEKVGIQ